MKTVSGQFEIAGFGVTVEGHEAVCRFLDREESWTEIPPGLEEVFRAEFGPGGRFRHCRPVVALDNAPALSSRQLGALLAVHRAVGGGAKLEVRGVRPNVRQLFKLAGMAEFFDYQTA